MPLGYQLISDVTVSGSAVTSVDFTGLNITKDDDYMLVSDLICGVNGYFHLFVNGNTTLTNYYTQDLEANSATVGAYRENKTVMSYLNAAGNKELSITKIKLTNSGYFVSNTTGNRHYELPSDYRREQRINTSTFTATSITQLTITAGSANGIAVGSRFQLYKCVATKVADITIGTATTSVDITGLNIDKTSEYMLVSDVVNATSSSSIYMFANNNTTQTNYYKQHVIADGTGVYGARTNNANVFDVGVSSNSFAITNIKLTNNGYIVTQSNTNYYYNKTTPQLLMYYTASTFTATSITQLTLTAQISNAIGIGSRFQLYKLK